MCRCGGWVGSTLVAYLAKSTLLQAPAGVNPYRSRLMSWLGKVDYHYRKPAEKRQSAEGDSEDGEKFSAGPIPGYKVGKRPTIVLMDLVY